MYAQLLLAASFAVASYQDVRDRAVSDIAWVPAIGGVIYVVYSFYVNPPYLGMEYYILKIGLIGGAMVILVFFGLIGQADAIAVALVTADPYPLSPFAPVLAMVPFFVAHVGYEAAVGNIGRGRTIPMEQFLREKCWIPKAIVADGTKSEVSGDVNVAREEVEAAIKPGAMVEVRYGVPTVAYLGIGYIVFLAYLFVFNYAAFVSLP